VPFAFPIHEFVAHLDVINARGLRTLTISELARRRAETGADAALDGTIALTFDDGYADLLTTVAPLLAERSMVATAFLTTSYLDGRSDGDPCHARWLSWAEAGELAATGCIEIGAHSHDHVELDMVGVEDARAQIRRCRERLRAEIGVDVTSFAYPYGYSTAAVRAVLADEGFTAACSVKHAISSTGDDVFDLARVRVLRRHSLETVTTWIEGAGLRSAPCREELRTRVFRPVRRVRHRVTSR
jgi:peptidoglycan/xylan/chitin deacetylase (PgdA/CDA1 family)